MTAKQYVLWGWTARLGIRAPVRICTGSLPGCRTRQRQFTTDYPDALTGIYLSGDEPKGLALQVQERVAPADARTA